MTEHIGQPTLDLTSPRTISSQQREAIQFLIFDLDGVITSEQKYWNTARLTVWELVTHPAYLGLKDYFGDQLMGPDQVLAQGDTTISPEFIDQLKRRAINSNWDLTYFVFCLHLAGMLQQYQQLAPSEWPALQQEFDLSQKQGWQRLGQSLQSLPLKAQVSQSVIDQFWQETAAAKGAAVLEHIPVFLQAHGGLTLPVQHSQNELWTLCYQNFQAWYEGRQGYQLPDDQTVVAVEQIQGTLGQLQASGQFTLAIATGRPRNEVIDPLTSLGLLTHFDPQRIVTYDEVLAAEAQLDPSSPIIKLGKPHPFVLLRALHLDLEPEVYCTEAFQQLDRRYAVYIGDAASDIVAAKRCGCLSIAVLTGFTPNTSIDQQRQSFYDLGCDLVIDSILDLPRALGMEAV